MSGEQIGWDLRTALEIALSNGKDILQAGFDFVVSKPIIFSICAFGLIIGAVKVIRKFI